MRYEAMDLVALRRQRLAPQNPFPHQTDALAKLTATYELPPVTSRGALLVLPTGAGKTYTAVKWLGDHVIPHNMRVLWLAQSFHLLDQASETFWRQAARISPPRQTLNMRLISSNPAHDKVSAIEPTDDVVIMTTQTAITALNVAPLDERGQPVSTRFREFLEACRGSGLFIVLDEAHHAPAYGCRNLLQKLREIVPNSCLLGLTATPTRTDERERGWLGKLFEQGVIYQASQTALIHQGILAQPVYIQKSTGRQYEVDDRMYERLVREHQDVPEEIVDRLVNDSARNDYIINEYISNRPKYGKTIIFADRWFQCEYFRKRLREKGVKADVVYSHVDADPGSAEARNRRTSDDNRRSLERFRKGEFDVLINVRMLTEGTDVPNVNTVFITRQTTSAILMTQMVGRALRGPKAGGTELANIVFFVDEWKRLINWANPQLEGEAPEQAPAPRGYYPLEYVSIRLVQELVKQIESGVTFQPEPFVAYLPVGWYQVELTVNTSAEGRDEMQSFTEFVMVYEHTHPKFEQFMAAVAPTISDEWARENLDGRRLVEPPPASPPPPTPSLAARVVSGVHAALAGGPNREDEAGREAAFYQRLSEQVAGWLDAHFEVGADDIGDSLRSDVIRVARHLAQNQRRPAYHSFEEREKYDLDRLARRMLFGDPPQPRLDEWAQVGRLRELFDEPGGLWPVFYGTFERFKTAFDAAKNRILMGAEAAPPPPPPPPPRRAELSEDEKKQIKLRDGRRCLACRGSGRGVGLRIDHIRPLYLGGETSIGNSQTLCSVCNGKKGGYQIINFRLQKTPLSAPAGELDFSLLRGADTDPMRSLRRLVNFFYRCEAVSEIMTSERRNGSHYDVWEIHLYAGNDPAWLEAHKQNLVQHVQRDLGCPHLRDIVIT